MLSTLDYTTRATNKSGVPRVEPMYLDPTLASDFVRANEAAHRHWRQVLSLGRRGRLPVPYFRVAHEDLSEGEAASKHWHALTAFLGLEVKDPRHKTNNLVRIHSGTCADKIVNARKSASGYSKAIWLQIAKDLGAKLRSNVKIRHAEGIRAKQGLKPTTILEVLGLEQAHIDEVMQTGLNKAVPIITQKMIKRVESKLAQLAAKKSGKRR